MRIADSKSAILPAMYSCTLPIVAACWTFAHLYGATEPLSDPSDLPQTSAPNTTYEVQSDLSWLMSHRNPYTWTEGRLSFIAPAAGGNTFSMTFEGQNLASSALRGNGGWQYLQIRNLNTLSVSNFTSAAVASEQGINIERCKAIRFSGNETGLSSTFGDISILYTIEEIVFTDHQGSAISSSGLVQIEGNMGYLRVNGNGGISAIVADTFVLRNHRGGCIEFADNADGSILGINGPVTIADNSVASITFSGNTGNAISAQVGGVSLLNNTGTITFSGNSATNVGGAIRSSATALIAGNKGDLAFLGNTAALRGGAVFSDDGGIMIAANTGSILFGGNRSGSYGGALCAQDDIEFTGNRGGIVFTGNRSAGAGGAICTIGGDVRFENNIGDIAFRGNCVATPALGGAIYTQEAELSIADNLGKVTMSGNYYIMNDADRHIVLNAVYAGIGPNTWRFAAPEGYSILFEDPVKNGTSSPLTVELNRTADGRISGGDIVFSGARTEELLRQTIDAQDDMTPERREELLNDMDRAVELSRHSDIMADTTLFGGRLVLEDGVVFGNDKLKDGTSFAARSGSVLEIVRHATLNAATFTMENGALLRAGSGAAVNAHTVDLSEGLLVDYAPFMGGMDSGLLIAQAESLTLGGVLRIHDGGKNQGVFYASADWAESREFVTLTFDRFSADARQGSFDGVESAATGSDTVDSPYAYRGSWSYRWSDADGDGVDDTLTSIWTPQAGNNAPTDILPELAGGLAMNSMWSSLSNARSLANAALGQLDAARLYGAPKNNYWAKGLGDFTAHASEGTRDGYTYNGGGFAVGGDRRIGENAVLGLAFGELFGKNASRSFAGKIDQTSRLGLIYGGWSTPTGSLSRLMVTASAGYGETENTMRTFLPGGQTQGSWDNKTFFATLRAAWKRDLGRDWTASLHIGAEYADAAQNAFEESGEDARRFGKGRLKNLALPVGAGIAKKTTLGGKPWTNELTVSYVPDLYRDNPQADAERLTNGFRWTARGIAPDRNAVRAAIESTLELNARWTLYAGYQFEGRNHAQDHRVNAGTSFSF